MKDKKQIPAKAVALLYGTGSKTPSVAAKGSGEIAKKIMALAKEHSIPIRQDPDLIELLARVDVLEEIPENLYAAVAEILAFIYSVNERKQGIPPETGTNFDTGTGSETGTNFDTGINYGQRTLHSGSGNDTPAGQIGSGGE